MSSNKTSVRHNEGKLDWTLLDFDSLEPLVKVMTTGELEYGRFNWQKPCKSPNEHIQSTFRHLTALNRGELYDKKSGELHSGHIMSNMMMYNYQINKYFYYNSKTKLYVRKSQE